MKLLGKIRTKPYLLCWVFAVLSFVLAVFYYFFGTTLDINIHDSYYIIAHFHLFLILGVWYALCGLGYWFIKNHSAPFVPWMIYVHIIGSISGLLLLMDFFTLFSPPNRLSVTFVSIEVMQQIYLVAITLSLFLFGQFIFCFHLLFSVFIRRVFFTKEK